jgi:hypothetical protein
MRMDLTERLAARGVLQPPRLRRLSAAHAPVRKTYGRREELFPR